MSPPQPFPRALPPSPARPPRFVRLRKFLPILAASLLAGGLVQVRAGARPADEQFHVLDPVTALTVGLAGVRQPYHRQTAPRGPAPVLRVRCRAGEVIKAEIEIPELAGDPAALDPRDIGLGEFLGVLMGRRNWFEGMAAVEFHAPASGRRWRWERPLVRKRVGYSGISKYRARLESAEFGAVLAAKGPVELHLEARDGNGRRLETHAVYLTAGLSPVCLFPPPRESCRSGSRSVAPTRS